MNAKRAEARTRRRRCKKISLDEEDRYCMRMYTCGSSRTCTSSVKPLSSDSTKIFGYVFQTQSGERVPQPPFRFFSLSSTSSIISRIDLFSPHISLNEGTRTTQLISKRLRIIFTITSPPVIRLTHTVHLCTSLLHRIKSSWTRGSSKSARSERRPFRCVEAATMCVASTIIIIFENKNAAFIHVWYIVEAIATRHRRGGGIFFLLLYLKLCGQPLF